jgi:hypothetical protein
MKNHHAVALGKRNKGKKKFVSIAESKRRREALAVARQKRWVVRSGVSATDKPKMTHQNIAPGET